MEEDTCITALAQAREQVEGGEPRDLLEAREIAFRETMVIAPEIDDVVSAEGVRRELIVLQAELDKRILATGGPTLDAMENAWLRFEDWKVWNNVSDSWALQVLREFSARYESEESPPERAAEAQRMG